jgi:hypothetical protein
VFIYNFPCNVPVSATCHHVLANFSSRCS